MLKIDTCIIVKNEEENLKQLIEQLLMFSDEVHITDTGSTDNTINIINEFIESNTNVFLHHFEWVYNFSEAKNFSLTCYDVKADYQFWCDGDDLLTENLIKKLIKFKSDPEIEKDQADIYYMNYMYCKYIENPRSSFHLRTSLLKVSTHHRWHDPIHEYIDINNFMNLNTSYFDADNDEYIEHQREHFVGPRNMEIFMNMEKTGWKFDARNYYYYMIELSNNGYYKLAYYIGVQCVFFDDNNIMDKINAARTLKDIQYGKKFVPSNKSLCAKNCIEYLMNKYNKEYIRGDLSYELANIYYSEENYEKAEQLYLDAVNYKLITPIFGFLYDETGTKINSLLQLNMIEYYQKHNRQKAKEYNEKILEYDPNHQVALNNIRIIDEQLKQLT